MSQHKGRVAKAGEGASVTRLVTQVVEGPEAQALISTISNAFIDVNGRDAASYADDVCYALMSLSAEYVALLPAGPHRDAVVEQAPALFQQLVSRAVAKGIEPDCIVGAMAEDDIREAAKGHAFDLLELLLPPAQKALIVALASDEIGVLTRDEATLVIDQLGLRHV